MNVALFGGTFDPIHRGHLAVARAARHQLMLDEILFVPSGVPPHKRAGAVTPFHDRHAMVVLATAGERSFVPSRLEDPDLAAGATYSIDTVRRLRRALGPSDRLFFLIGADAFLDIATWRGADVLTREVEFVVASRPGFSLAALPERVRDRATLHLVPGVSERISAADVRRAVRSGQRLEDLVDPAVSAYIYRAGLYRANPGAHHRSETRSKTPAAQRITARRCVSPVERPPRPAARRLVSRPAKSAWPVQHLHDEPDRREEEGK